MLTPRTPRLVKHKSRYSLVFYDPRTQRRKWIALGTESKTTAERRARPMILAYERGEWHPWRDVWVEATSLAAALERWAEAKKNEQARPRTINNVRYVVGRLIAALPAGITVDAVEPADVRRIVTAPPSPGAQAAYRRTLASFFSWAQKAGLTPTNPVQKVQRIRVERTAPYFLRPEEARRLIDAADLELRPLIQLAIGSGLRRGELLALRPADVRDGMIHVRAETAKGRADRMVPLSAWAAAAVPSLPIRVSHERATKGVRRAADAAGLPLCHLHTLRHTFASWLRIGGAPIDRIQYWLGHRTILQTMVYAHLEPTHLRGEFERFFGGNVGPLLPSAVVDPNNIPTNSV